MTTRLDEKAFFERIRALQGFNSDDEAVAAIRATLAALRAQLDDGDRAALAEALPAAWSDALRTSQEPVPSGRGEFFERVQASEHVPFGVAEEHAEEICRALGEMLPPKAMKRLDRVLPKSIDALFHRP